MDLTTIRSREDYLAAERHISNNCNERIGEAIKRRANARDPRALDAMVERVIDEATAAKHEQWALLRTTMRPEWRI